MLPARSEPLRRGERAGDCLPRLLVGVPVNACRSAADGHVLLDPDSTGVGGGIFEAAALPEPLRHLASEGDGPERVDLALGRVLPDLEHRRADVAVRVEVDRAERAFVVDVLSRPQEPDRLAELEIRDLRTRWAGDRDQVDLDLRRRRRAGLERGEEGDVRSVEGRALEARVRLRAGDV